MRPSQPPPSSSSSIPSHAYPAIHLQQQHNPAAFDINPQSQAIFDAALAQLALAGNSPHYTNAAQPAAPSNNSHHSHRGASHPHLPSPPTGSSGLRHDSGIAGVATHDWQRQHMQSSTHSSMGVPVTQLNQGVKRARSQHQRTPSASSTIASNGPASPYMQNGSYPHIVNTDSPNAQPFYPLADQAFFAKVPSQTFDDQQLGYLPSQIPNAHLAMKGFGLNHHSAEEYLPDFAPSRQSMSSYGTDSPATPQSGVGDTDAKQYNMQQNDYQRNPNLQLFRTESQAFQDELYDPNAAYNTAPAKSSNAYLAPQHAHRNLLGERLQTANLVRSASPSSGISRDRSPFRDGSPLAPTQDWKQGGPVGTAASMRQQQKEQAAQAEFAQHRAPLRREPTKTISPKDALLEYNDNDQQPLFQDTIPAGFEKHMGGTEQWPSNTYLSQPGASFGSLNASGHPTMNFRNATADGYSGTTMDFQPSLPQGTDQVQSYPFQANYQTAVASKMNNLQDPTPDFPATIPSMETSISDAGLPASSQESNGNGYTSVPQRPDDTRANTGTYTCTYHGCTQRFDSHANLQKHKRDYHRSQQPSRDSASSPSGTASTSPRSTESPAPSGSGMTSAALLARNSQAGPHKCTRINPSTNKPCNTIFSRPYDLTRHEDTIHNNRKQKVRCPMCREEKTFSRNDALTRHMRVVHPEVESFGKRTRRGD